MSRVIDEKVVEMRFDNQDFERNVSQSMSTLDKLKHALDFSGAEKSFDGISSAIDKVQFGGMSDALDTVSEKFTALEAVALGALANIGAKLSDLAIETVKSLSVDQVTAGFDKYAQKTKSVQTIMNMTGKEIDEVEEELSKLMWYADETSYSFTDMTSNAALFAAQGIELETAVTAMQGISNWAGLLGASKEQASRVMFNLSQALSAGYIRQIDWKSVMTANMADEKFRQLAIDIARAQGTLAEFADDSAIADWVAELQDAGRDISADQIEKFATDYLNGMLDVDAAIQATGMSMDDLIDKLSTGLVYLAAVDSEGNEILKNEKSGEKMLVNANTFAETLTKGKWFTNDVLLETLQNYGEYTGQLYEWYTKLQESGYDVTTSELIGFVNDFSQGSLDIQAAMDATGMSAEELTETLSLLSQDEYDLGRRALEASQAALTFQDAIDATKDAVSSQWLTTFQILFGNYEEAKVLWTDLANELWDIFAGPVSDMNDMLTSWRDDFGGHEALIQGFKNLYFAVRSYIDPITEMWNEVFPPMTAERLAEITKNIETFTENLILSDEQADKLATGFKGLFDIIGFVGDIIGQLVNSFFPALKEGLGDSSDTLLDLIEQFGEWGSSLPETLKNTELFADGLNDISGALSYLGRYLGTLLSLTRLVDAFNEAGGGLAGAINMFRDTLGVSVDFLLVAFQNLTGIDITGWKDKVILAFDAVTEAVLRFADFIARSFGWEENPFKEVLDTSSGALEQLKITFAGFSGIDLTAFTSFYDAVIDKLGPLGSIFDGLKNVGKGIWEFLEKTAPVIGTVLTWIGDTISKLGDVIAKYFGSLTLSDIFEAIQAGGILALVIRLGWVFDGLAEGLEALAKKVKVDIIRSIAMSIIMLAGAALMISAIDADKMTGTMVILGEAMAAMIASLLGAMKLSSGANAKTLLALPTLVTSVGFAMIEMAAAMMLLTKPVKEFGEMESGGLLKGFGTVLASLGTFLGASWLMPVKANNSAKAIQVVSNALIVLAGVIKIYSMLNTETFASGLKRIAGALAVIISIMEGANLLSTLISWLAAAKGASSSSLASIGTGLIKFSEGLVILAAAVWLFDKIDLGTLAGGILKMVAAFAGLVLASAILSRFSDAFEDFADSIEKIGKGVLFLTLGLSLIGIIAKLFGDSVDGLVDAAFDFLAMTLQKLATRIPELGAYIMDILLQVGALIAENAPQLTEIIMDIVMSVLQGVGEALAQMDFEPFLKGTGFIAAFLLAIFGLKKMHLTLKDFLSTAAMIAGVGVLIAEIVALFALIGNTQDFLLIQEGLDSFSQMADALGTTFISKFGILVTAIAGLLVLFEKLHIGTVGAGAFGSVVVLIAEVAGVIEAMGILFALGGQINEWIEMIPGVGEGGLVERINKFGEMVNAIADVLGGVFGHLIGSFAGGVTGATIEIVMQAYTDGLAYMAEHGAEFFSLMDSLKEGTLQGCKYLAEMILTLTGASILDGLTSWLTGKASFKDFADQLKEMGEPLSVFAATVGEVTEDQANAAIRCARILDAFVNIAPRSGGLYQHIVGEKDLGVFGEQLESFGRCMARFAVLTADLDEEVVKRAANCAKIIMSFANEAPNSGGLLKWIVGEKNLATFGDQLAAFGVNLYKYSEFMKLVDVDAIGNSSDVINSLVKSADKVEDVALGGLFSDETSMKEFGKQLVSFGKSFYEYSQTIGQINQYKVSGVAQAISDTIDAFAGSDDSGLVAKIKTIGDKVLDGVTNMFLTDDAKKKTQTAAGQLLQYISEKFLEDASVAMISIKITDLFTRAFGDGQLTEGLKQAALNLITQIQNGMSEGLDSEEGPAAAFAKFLTQLETEIGKNDRQKIFYDNGLKLLNSFRNGLTYEANTAAVLEKLKVLLDTLAGELISQDNLNRFNAGGKALIGAVVSGMSGAEVQQQVRDASTNITAGVAEGMTSNDALAKVQQSSKKVVNSALQTMKQVAEIRSPSKRFKEVIGEKITFGVAEGVWDAVPALKEKAKQVLDIIIDSVSDTDFVNNLKEAGLDVVDIFGGGILDGLSTDYLSEIGYEIPNTLLTTMDGYVNEGGFFAVAEDALFDFSDGVEGYLPTIYEQGEDTVYTFADGMIDAAEKTVPLMINAGETMGDAFADTAMERIQGVFGYVDYIMKELDDGTTTRTVVHDFDTMKMEHDELEAYLLAFDNATAAEQQEMIRQMEKVYNNQMLADYLKSTIGSRGGSGNDPETWANIAANISREYNEATYEKTQRAREAAEESKETNRQLGEAVFFMKNLDSQVSDLSDKVGDLEVVLDTGELVGATTSKYDTSLGNKSVLSKRGI